MIGVDVSTTSQTPANTGVQRVTRKLASHLGDCTKPQPLCFDSHAKDWRKLERKEFIRLFHFETLKPSQTRGRRKNLWSFLKAIGGHRSSSLHVEPSSLNGFIEPEIFDPVSGVRIKEYKNQVKGPSVAVYYDATPLKLPELSTRKNVNSFPVYLKQLLFFDGVAAISKSSKEEILEYWNWLGVKEYPVTVDIPLAVDLQNQNEGHKVSGNSVPTILCVGSIEGRKNQISLLHAAEILWNEGVNFKLLLIGLASRSTSGSVMALLKKLSGQGHPVQWLGHTSEADLELNYAKCHFTVYPSLAEGFGLPILESLKYGKPCICSNLGAIGEISTKGGCLTVDSPTPTNLASSMSKLLKDDSLYDEIRLEARQRQLRTWSDYANDIKEFQESLKSRWEAKDSS